MPAARDIENWKRLVDVNLPRVPDQTRAVIAVHCFDTQERGEKANVYHSAHIVLQIKGPCPCVRCKAEHPRYEVVPVNDLPRGMQFDPAMKFYVLLRRDDAVIDSKGGFKDKRSADRAADALNGV